jgi:hypothetical protein
MTWTRTLHSSVMQFVVPATLAIGLAAAPPPAAAQDNSEKIARLAMSTASVMMMGEHEHEIAEALEEGDFEEALEEAEELVPWMKGADWSHELMEPVGMATAALEALVARLEAKDADGARTALEEVEKHFHHVHHELMELVGEGMSH